mmetsp:Transcript_38557/g.101834  ORF Transcript_38557/g.101834 Transcript_38557/m.101834 type:complete len:117 (+) Transcript_38557:1-351(+)
MWHLDPFGANRDKCRRALHPLVHRHTVTGKLSLQLGPSPERSILEGAEAESQEAQESQAVALTDEAVAAGAVYHHIWENGDIVIWDNSQCMHRSNPYDKSEYVRKALRVGVISEMR